ncbi:MAG: cysteine synthase family protein [Deltaproteobacteria bacterium]|nr:cysteine synthase family protein [Deltaproteobacteria bacterium]
MRLDSILGAIGETPLVTLQRVRPLRGTLLLKLEAQNPGGSAKDRAVKSMVLAAEQAGALKPGATLVEGTAGNTGIGLALVAAARGYKAVVAMPRNASADKQAVLRLLGAEIVLTPPDLPLEHPESYVAVAERMAKERPGAHRLGQFENLANPDAHFDTTGPELWRDCAGRVDVLVGCIGTSGTLSGTTRFLRERNPSLRLVVGQPAQEPTVVEGITDEDPSENFGGVRVDARHRVEDTESISIAQRVAREEGLLIGLSAGTAVAAALRDSASWREGDVAVVIAPDTARNYLRTLAPSP